MTALSSSCRLLACGAALGMMIVACSGYGENVSVGSDAVKAGDSGTDTDGGGGSADGGTPCKSDLDCQGESPAICVYTPTSKCGDYGVCFSTKGLANCNSISPGCSCGGIVNLACNQVPAGYVVGPEATEGECPVEADASTCKTNADCGSNEQCGFSEADGCTAIGKCVPNESGGLCGAVSLDCGCDGTSVTVGCNGYPSNYAAKPIAHTGACDGG